jgi:uncharacterized surface protein with fasciclin (FAS1) repeats
VRIKQLLAVACIAALSLTVVACGDDDESTSSTTDTTQQTSTAPTGNIVVVAKDTPDLSTLVKAVTAAGLAQTLQGKGPYTVFAPTNKAFSELGDQLDTLLEPDNKNDLSDILLYHVVEGDVKAADLEDGEKLKTVQGDDLTVSVNGDEVKVNDATVVKADVPAENGTVHVIDGVLTPPQ